MAFSFVFPLNGGGSGGGGGSVTSVGLAMPSTIFDVANSPVTGAGTITVTYKSQNANLVLASTDGIVGVPTFRSLVAGDLPTATTSNQGAIPIATDAEALAGSILNKAIVPSSLNYTLGNYQIGAITPNNNSIASTDTINAAFAKAQGQINAKQDTLTFGNLSGTEFNITGGTNAIIGSGVTLALANTTVTAASYGDATNVATFTVDSKGRLTAAGSVAISFPPAPVTSVFSRTGAVTAQANDYTFAQIGSKPTTLAGYGITDAVQTGTSASVTNVSITGTAGAGYLNLPYQSSLPSGLASNITLSSGATGDLSIQKNGNAFTNYFSFSGTTNRTYTFPDVSGSVLLGSSLTSNRLLRWDGTNVVNSVLQDDGTDLNVPNPVVFKLNTSVVGSGASLRTLVSINGKRFICSSEEEINYGNLYVGKNAGNLSATTASYITAIGDQALKVATSDYSTGLGNGAGLNHTTGAWATYIGAFAGKNNTTGARNVYVGFQAGQANNGSDNVIIGTRSVFSASGFSNAIIIGSQADGTNIATNKLYIDSLANAIPLIGGDFSSKYVSINGSLVVGTTSPNASAIFQADSTTKGILIPRMNSSQSDAISITEGLIVGDTTNHRPIYHTNSARKQLAFTTDIASQYYLLRFAPLTALVSTVPANIYNATGILPSTSASGVTTTYQSIESHMIHLASTIDKISVRLTQACTDQPTVGSNPTVRIDVYKHLSTSRTLIATYRVPITITAGIGTSSTPGTLTTGINTTYELTGLSDALAVGDLIGCEFVAESGTTKLSGVTNLQINIVTKIS